MRRAAAALLSLRFVPFIREKVFQRGEQKGAEFAFFAIERREIILRQEPREKSLGQVLGILAGMAATPDIGVKRKPIRLAQLLQRRIRLRC